MTAAGVQRGMELDIHPKTVTFNIIHPSRTGSTPRSSCRRW
jgi:hypothetical protein